MVLFVHLDPCILRLHIQSYYLVWKSKEGKQFDDLAGKAMKLIVSR